MTNKPVQMSQAEGEAIEEHLFSCDECELRLREIITLADGVGKLARQGDLLMVVNAFLKRAAEEGLCVREYTPPPGGSVHCTVSAEDDFLIGRLTADLKRGKAGRSFDLPPPGRRSVQTAGRPYRPGSGSVAFQQPINYAKAAPSETMIARLVAFDEAGGERVLGEYTFIHTRTMPDDPGAW